MTFEEIQAEALSRCEKGGDMAITIRGTKIPPRRLDRMAMEILLEYIHKLEARVEALEGSKGHPVVGIPPTTEARLAKVEAWLSDASTGKSRSEFYPLTGNSP